ncbi:glycosyl hydrolase family 61-domain-containing protein [Aspergillus varians]
MLIKPSPNLQKRSCIKPIAGRPLLLLLFIAHSLSFWSCLSLFTLFSFSLVSCPPDTTFINHIFNSFIQLYTFKMKTFGLLALAATAKMVSAHATVMAVWINDVDQGLGNTASGYIRSPPNNDPVTDVTSTDMTCNVNGKTAAAKTLEVAGGDKITFEWHHDSRSSSDDIIASSHLGPVMVYMAPTTSGAAGSGWVKIAEDGYDDGEWATTKLIANKGKHSITVPDVPAGDYLFRPEIIALHEGNREGGAQFYMECVQFKVTSDGANTLPSGVSIPGDYTATDAGILFDVYNSFTSYPFPGPSVWDGTSSNSTSSSSSSAATSTTAAATTAAATTSTAAAEITTSVTTEVAAASTEATTESTTTEATTEAVTETATQTTIPVSVSVPTFVTSVRPTSHASASHTSTAAAYSETPSASGTVAIYQQCGGLNHTGGTVCASGLTCKHYNPYYYQCIQE